MLSEEQFQELARLARLDPHDATVQAMRSEFNKILEYVDVINQVDVSDIDDSYSEDRTRNVVRADQPAQSLALHDIAAIAPRWEAGHFVVPGAIESEG